MPPSPRRLVSLLKRKKKLNPSELRGEKWVWRHNSLKVLAVYRIWKVRADVCTVEVQEFKINDLKSIFLEIGDMLSSFTCPGRRNDTHTSGKNEKRHMSNLSEFPASCFAVNSSAKFTMHKCLDNIFTELPMYKSEILRSGCFNLLRNSLWFFKSCLYLINNYL